MASADGSVVARGCGCCAEVGERCSDCADYLAAEVAPARTVVRVDRQLRAYYCGFCGEPRTPEGRCHSCGVGGSVLVVHYDPAAPVGHLRY